MSEEKKTRKKGRRVKFHTPLHVYNRKRKYYHRKYQKNLITDEQYDKFLDKILEEYRRDKKIHKSLKDFE